MSLGGTAEAGSSVEVFEGATSKGTTTATGGNWTITITNVPDGAHAYIARATDAAGNTSGNSNTRTITIDSAIPDTSITDGPGSPTNDSSPSFSFTSTKANSTFRCKLDGPGAATGTFAACASPKAYTSLADGDYTFSVVATDPLNHTDPTPDTQTFTVDTAAPASIIDAGPSGAITVDPTFTFHSPDDGARFECRMSREGAPANDFSPCNSPKTYGDLSEVEGTYTFEVRATDAAGNTGPAESRTFVVDLTPPPADVTSGPSGPTTDPSPAFAFASTETGSTFECRLDGPGAATGTYGPCTSPASFSGLQPGDYVFLVRATDPAGNQTVTSRSFTVTTTQGRISQQPPPTPTPEPNKTVVIQPISGKTLVKLPGSSKFEPVDITRGIPNGSTVDTKKSKIRLFAIPKAGKPAESALFYAGHLQGQAGRRDHRAAARRGAREVPLRQGGGGQEEEAQDAQAVGRRLRQLPHARPVQRGDRPRHPLARARLLWQDADRGGQGRGRGAGLRQEEEGPRARAQALHRQAEETMTALLLAAVLIGPVSGDIRIKPPGGAFAPLTTSQTVDYGSTVDAVHGTAKIAPSATQKALAKGAVFTVTQGDGVTVLRTTSCRRTFTVSTPTGGFTTRTGKMTITARGNARWEVSRHCHYLRVLRGTVEG